MMEPLRQVASFASIWHRGEWRSRDLPDAVGADILWRSGGASILGFALSYPEHSYIVLNRRISGTPLEWPVVYHECAHLIQGDLLGFCGNSWAERQCERNATYGSAILAIPADDAIALVGRRATAHELADHYEIPPQLVYMRGALAVLLGEVDGDRQHAREQLAVSRRALERWTAWQARGLGT